MSNSLGQIEKRHYDAEYKDFGYKKYVKYGICFCKKTCRVEAFMEE